MKFCRFSVLFELPRRDACDESPAVRIGLRLRVVPRANGAKDYVAQRGADRKWKPLRNGAVTPSCFENAAI